MEHHQHSRTTVDSASENSIVDFSILQTSPAFRQLQKQIQKMRKHLIAEGHSPKQALVMLQEILLRQGNREIDWRNLNNTSDYYSIMEKFNSSQQITESVLKFKQEINQMKTSFSTQQQKQDLNESKQNGIQLNVDEISERFLYRLDHSCKIDQGSSSSSSESGDSENYSYHLNENIIQQEQDIQQKQLKIQQQKHPSTIASKEDATSLHSVFITQNSTKTPKEKKRKPNHLVNFQPEASSLVNDEDRQIFGNKQQKKLKRDQKNEEFSVVQHKYAGKKRNFLFNPFREPGCEQLQEGLQNIAELEEIKLLEQKFRYFTENGIIDEDAYPTQK